MQLGDCMCLQWLGVGVNCIKTNEEFEPSLPGFSDKSYFPLTKTTMFGFDKYVYYLRNINMSSSMLSMAIDLSILWTAES